MGALVGSGGTGEQDEQDEQACITSVQPRGSARAADWERHVLLASFPRGQAPQPAACRDGSAGVELAENVFLDLTGCSAREVVDPEHRRRALVTGQ